MDCLQEKRDAVWLHRSINCFRIWFHTSRPAASNWDSITATFMWWGLRLYVTVMWHLLLGGTKIALCVFVCSGEMDCRCCIFELYALQEHIGMCTVYSVCIRCMHSYMCPRVWVCCLYVCAWTNSGGPRGCTGNPICVLEAQAQHG